MHSRERLHQYLQKLLENKHIVILGFAREGVSTYKTLRSFFPTIEITILDKSEQLTSSSMELLEKDENLHLSLGSDYLSVLDGESLIIKTPGIPSLLTQIQDAIGKGAYLTSQTDIFFQLFSKQIIAVTGTKGKSTASAVIEDVLSTAGLPTIFLGNIGHPSFDAIDEIDGKTFIVYETSSHQAEGVRTGPGIGIFLNLFTDHLDYYSSFESYAQAKRQLFLAQGSEDTCMYNSSDERVVDLIATTPGFKIGFSLEKTPTSQVYEENGYIVAYGERLIATSDIPLLGTHNILNCMPAVIVAHQLGITNDDLIRGLKTIKPVKKRLETVAHVNGVSFVDDALATIPEATIAALHALGDGVETLLVGGHDRGQDFFQLSRAIASSHIQTLILFPTTGEKIAQLVAQYNTNIQAIPVTSMGEAVACAKRVTTTGKTVLLSTASASFGMFKDYEDRSQQYLSAITSGIGK